MGPTKNIANFYFEVSDSGANHSDGSIGFSISQNPAKFLTRLCACIQTLEERSNGV
jgi:hypothetical protein